LLGVLSLLAGCKRGGSSRLVGSDNELSDPELRYGVPPTRNSSVVYQDDVVIVGGGAKAVRSVSSNTLTWTIDARAPHAEELQPGKIMFLTNRAVGRVLAIQRTGADLAVTLGPLALTDVIKEANVSFDTPIDLNSMIAYVAPDLPGAVGEPAPTSASLVPEPPTLMPVSFRSLVRPNLGDFSPFLFQAMPGPTVGPLPERNISDFSYKAFCCPGMGLQLTYKDSGLVVQASVQLHLQNPSLHFNLVISGATIRSAEVELKGVAGLTWIFDAVSEGGVQANVNKELWVPVELALLKPIGDIPLPVPFAVTFQEGFILHTGFTARNSRLRAAGEYAFTGSLRAGLHDGTWALSAPTQLTIKQSLPGSVAGASLGMSAMVMAFKGRAIVGIGAFGFVTGPYLEYVTSIGITKNSPTAGAALMLPDCRSANLVANLNGGVGYKIPHAVATGINAILKIFNLSVPSVGGVEMFSQRIIEKHGDWPDGCSRPPKQGMH